MDLQLAPALEEEKNVQPQSGYFDEIADILALREHPIIVVEASALRWMGVREINDEDLELLVRDKDLAGILADLIATGQYDLVDHNPADPLRYGYVAGHVPRLRRQHCLGLYTHLDLWSETMYHLSCDVPLVEVPDLMAWNVGLVEDEFDPVGPDAVSVSVRTRQADGVKMLHPVMAQTAGCRRPIYIPSIPVFIDAFLDQGRHRLAHPENYLDMKASLPLYHISNFIRYLFLENGYRRDRILSKLAPRNRPDMEIRMNRYKRKPLYTGIYQIVSRIPARHL
ncbi:MAG: hypothetical protein M1826_002193 [Phylliscum demangeonii]|nr:MAG: hypothetical protein M1826_002193 [Phylliscum demangeonii]